MVSNWYPIRRIEKQHVTKFLTKIVSLKQVNVVYDLYNWYLTNIPLGKFKKQHVIEIWTKLNNPNKLMFYPNGIQQLAGSYTHNRKGERG